MFAAVDLLAQVEQEERVIILRRCGGGRISARFNGS